MFEKFGEMDSYTEINELAENLCNEEDLPAWKKWQRKTGFRKNM